MPEETTNNEIDDSYSKPGFDGRLHYYKLVSKYMAAIAFCQSNEDYHGWINNLSGLFDLVSPFIKNRAELRVKLIALDAKIDSLYHTTYNKQNQAVLDRFLEKELHDLTQELYISAKHMMLPISEDKNDVFDEDEFMSGSDL